MKLATFTYEGTTRIGPWIVTGDVVRIEIEGIGAIENTVIDEPAETAFVD